jgi:NYN domain
MSANEKLFALLIDGDNANSKMIQQILDRVATLGKVLIKNVYYNKASLDHWEPVINKYSLYSVFVPNNTKKKNSVDITLVVDAMAMLYRRPEVTSFCIVASDADYTALAKQIQTENKYVLGIGEAKTPETFRNACSEFIYIEDLADTRSAAKPVINSADKTYLRSMIKAYKQVLKQGPEDAQGRVTLREIWETMKASDAAFSVEYKQIIKFINKVKGFAEIYPENIVLATQADSKPAAHFIQFKNAGDKKISSEIDRFREAYEYIVKEPKLKTPNGWVSLSAIGTTLREMYPNYQYLVYGDITYSQLNKVVKKMSVDHPKVIELNGSKQTLQLRFKKSQAG